MGNFLIFSAFLLIAAAFITILHFVQDQNSFEDSSVVHFFQQIHALKSTSDEIQSSRLLKTSLKVTLNETDPGQFIFVVGLEGSGHHIFESIWNQCSQCAYGGAPAKMLYRATKRETTGLFAEKKPSKYQELIHLLTEEMKLMSKFKKGNNIILNTWVEFETGQISYPNFYPPERYVHHPHLLNLAKVASDANVRIKFLVIFRSGPAIIKSTTINRHFTSRSDEIRTLEDMCHEIMYTVMAFGHENIGCIDYDDPEKGLKSAAQVLDFDASSFEEVFKSVYHRSSNLDPAELFSDEDMDFMATLNRCLSNLKRFCFSDYFES